MSYQSLLTGAFLDQQLTDKLVTPEGGIAIKMINATGANSVKGSVLSIDTVVERGVRLQVVEYDCIGIMYSDGVANGEDIWVVISGVAEVLLEDGIAGTIDYWTFAADVDGRADMLAQPPGGTITAIDNHFKEIGHCIETVASGTDVLCKIVTHFN